MTATAVAPSATPSRSRTSPYRLSFPRLVRSEAIKLVTLRSPWWSIAVVAVISIGLSLLLAWSFQMLVNDGGVPASGDLALSAVLGPTDFTFLLATILGSTLVTGEYSTGMIRSTLTAAPGRIGSLLAKATVVAVFVFVASLAILAVAALATAPLLDAAGIRLDLGDPGKSVLPIVSGAFTMAIIAILGLSAGYILRNGPGAIALGVGLVFVLPLVPAFFPATDSWQWIRDASNYLPTSAGRALMLDGQNGGLDTLPALLTLIAWAVIGLAAGAAVLKSRDA